LFKEILSLFKKNLEFRENVEFVQGKCGIRSGKIWSLFKKNLKFVQGKSGVCSWEIWSLSREEISGRKRLWGFKNHVKFEKNRFFSFS